MEPMDIRSTNLHRTKSWLATAALAQNESPRDMAGAANACQKPVTAAGAGIGLRLQPFIATRGRGPFRARRNLV
jgi:hypothetical protein